MINKNNDDDDDDEDDNDNNIIIFINKTFPINKPFSRKR